MSLPAFRIDRTEVTVEAYARCVARGACATYGLGLPHYFGRDQPDFSWCCTWGKPGKARHPLNCVDWAEAADYCRWAHERLPTEAEWEKAARGADGRKFPWGNQGLHANVADRRLLEKHPDWPGARDYDDGFEATAPAGSFPDGASPYGALDLAGNVQEWTADSYDARKRVVKGGSWDEAPRTARASHRRAVEPELRGGSVGFRCAADPLLEGHR